MSSEQIKFGIDLFFSLLVSVLVAAVAVQAESYFDTGGVARAQVLSAAISR